MRLALGARAAAAPLGYRHRGPATPARTQVQPHHQAGDNQEAQGGQAHVSHGALLEPRRTNRDDNNHVNGHGKKRRNGEGTVRHMPEGEHPLRRLEHP